MKPTPASYCKHCRFYHGGSRMVCAVHPCGPDSNHCLDYSPNSSRHQEQTSNRWSNRQFSNWKSLQRLTLALLASVGLSCVLGWLATHPTAPTIKITKNTQLR